MKKLLAMVLALVMTLSLAVSASAFKDDKDISADYAEAAAVLDGMGVFEGVDGSFLPKDNITRAQVATIIYRVATADTAGYGKDKSGLYATYNKFSDMTGAGWASGYIGYAANAEYVKGYPDGTFKPSGNVTGYEVLAMILRVVGYDKNNEFSGADWALNVAKYAESLGILDNVDKSTDLSAPASRELVAELLFQAIQKDMVTYTPAFGYVTDKVADLKQTSIGYKNFKLASDDSEDAWGRPTTVWFEDSDKDLKFDSSEDTYAEVTATPKATFNVETSQCDICEALGVKKTTTVVDTYTNGVKDTKDVTYTATATKAMVGAQGQQLEYYKVDGGYRLVVIDTYLAKVADVVAEKLDAKGHVIRDDYMKLTCYKTADKDETLYVAGNDYAEDDYVLVNVNEKVTDKIVGVGEVKLVEIVGKAESFEGAQSKNWYNAAKHTIDDKDYNDAVRFYLDEAGTTKTAKFTWFLDQFGNLIGDAAIDNSNYAVLKDIIWNVGRPGSAEATLVFMDGKEENVTVNSIDGLEYNNNDENSWGTEGAFDEDLTASEPTLADIAGYVGFDGEIVLVSSDGKYNGGFEGMALYKVSYDKDGNVDLVGYKTVSYDYDVTVDTNASLIGNLNVGTSKLNINDNTEFLVRSGEGTKADPYTYTSYNRNNLPQYAALSAEIYYTVGTDGFVNRVYIKNAADAASFGDHLFVTTKSYYKPTGEKDVYKMDVVIDGEDQTVTGSKDVMEYLAKNQNKLFHVEWVKDSGNKDYYGHIASVALINEWEDSDKDYNSTEFIPAEGACDYVTGAAMIKGQTIVSDHFNWTITSNTKFVGAKDLNDIDLEDDGIWVVASGSKYSAEAAYVYVGEKLDEGLNLTVTAVEGTVAYDKTNAKNIVIKYTSVKDATKADMTMVADDDNAVIELVSGSDKLAATSAEWTGFSIHKIDGEVNGTIKVYNEAGTASQQYTLVAEWVESETTGSIKYTVNFYDSNNKTVTDTKTYTSANLTPGTYVYDGTPGYTANWILEQVNATPASWNVSYATPNANVVAGGTAEVVLNVYPVAHQ